MNELSTITFQLLLGLLTLYVAIFWLVGLASVIVSYVHDGEKDYSSFYEPEKWWWCCEAVAVKIAYGFMLPAGSLCALMVFAAIDESSGMSITPAIILIAAVVCAILRITRAVIRLTKKLDSHASNKNAHN